MKVDNKTNVPFNDKRNTVRISTTDRFAVGSVWIADMLHVPFGVSLVVPCHAHKVRCSSQKEISRGSYRCVSLPAVFFATPGRSIFCIMPILTPLALPPSICVQCSVWPAFWSQAPNWPVGGEIDTFEGVNMVHNSQSSLHTEPGCTAVNAVQTSTLVNSTDCSFKTNSNEGCVVEDPDPNSYGAAFAAAGGGVFVTEFAETGISCVVLSFFLLVMKFAHELGLYSMHCCQYLVLLGVFILRPFLPSL